MMKIEIEEFVLMTRRIIAKDGFDDYLPTAIYPNRQRISVLEGVPDNMDIEPIALDWAIKNAVENEDFLLAFKISPTEFKVIQRYSNNQKEAVFDVVG